jgi:hypothetical protein
MGRIQATLSYRPGVLTSKKEHKIAAFFSESERISLTNMRKTRRIGMVSGDQEMQCHGAGTRVFYCLGSPLAFKSLPSLCAGLLFLFMDVASSWVTNSGVSGPQPS